MTSHGTLVHLTIRSYELVREMRLIVYLPPLYGKYPLSYPALYLLHPWGADEHYWVEEIGLCETADHLIERGAVPPFVGVMPQGDKSFFIDAANPRGDYRGITRLDPVHFAGALEGCGDYGCYLLNDVLGEVERRYAVRRDRAGRVIAGVGMGGAGAGVLAFSHPELFGAVGMHSPTLFDKTRLGPPWLFGLGDEAAFTQRDPVSLAMRLDRRRCPRIFLDHGLEDEAASACVALHDVLEARGLTHVYHSRTGQSSADVWRGCLAEYLGFYAAGW